MTPEQTSLLDGLKAPLLTIDDAHRFWSQESVILQAFEAAKATLTVLEHANLQARMNTQVRQAAWLRIEQAFANDPDLATVSISRDEEEGRYGYLYVEMGAKGDDHAYGLGEYPGGADEQLQMFINDMGRKAFEEFHDDLVQLGTVEHDDLDAGATAILGDAWNAARRAALLKQALPTPSKNAFKPRF